MSTKTLIDAVAGIQARIRTAAERAGSDPRGVSLLAVTKTQPREAVLEAYEAGIRLFGENRVQEAAAKYRDLPQDIELHLIGHLQTNKAKEAASLFSCVQSLDSFRTAEALDRRLGEAGRKTDYLIEINTSGETSKSGYASYEHLLADLDSLLGLRNLRLRGLMTVGPLTEEIGPVRKAFRSLRAYFDDLRRRLPELSLDVLSMGMSSDYETAVEEGSTMVRIGTLIFGSRRPQ